MGEKQGTLFEADFNRSVKMAELFRAVRCISLLGAVVVNLAACGGARTTVAQVDELLREHTPVGTSHERVVTVLDSLNVEHSPFDPQERYVLAIWRVTARSVFVHTSIQARFSFDEGGRLLEYELKELFTGT